MKERWAGLTVRVEIRQDVSVPLWDDNGRTITMRAAVRFVISAGISGCPPRRYVYTTDLLTEEWLLPSRNDGTTSSRYLAIQWWRELTQNLVKNPRNVCIGSPIRVNNVEQELASIEEIIAQVENGTYQARPGDHCHYCPVKSLCLGWQTGGV
jgi:hypothetical protein